MELAATQAERLRRNETPLRLAEKRPQRDVAGSRAFLLNADMVDKPILIGTWAAASWAIEFYRRNGFTVVPTAEKDHLLRTYWSIPDRQVETSVVLARREWMEGRP